MREGYALPPPASAIRPRRPADLLWSPGVHTVKEHDAGWSSSVARWAHNPEVEGSNPSPATKARRPFLEQRKGLLHVVSVTDTWPCCAFVTVPSRLRAGSCLE